MYTSDKTLVRSTADILLWWSHHQQVYPLLSKAAKKYLAVQATSCAVERTFSTSGNTVTTRRTLLMSKNVEMLVYCKEDIPKVPMTGLILKNDQEQFNEEDAKKNHMMNLMTSLKLECDKQIIYVPFLLTNF